MKTQTALDFLREKAKSVDNLQNTKYVDIEFMICSLLSIERVKLFADPPKISEKQKKDLNSMIIRRNEGEPLAYILEKKYFWNIEIDITKDVLVPRPETEVMVEEILELFKEDMITVLDLGTGSGALALALVKERPRWDVVASDISLEALETARNNAKKLNLNINLVQANWLESFSKRKFNLIISNPPYMNSEDKRLTADGLKFEPKVALVSERGGFAHIENISLSAPLFLKKGGYLFLEHGPLQTRQVRSYLHQAQFIDLSTYKDLNGDNRVTSGKRS